MLPKRWTVIILCHGYKTYVTFHELSQLHDYVERKIPFYDIIEIKITYNPNNSSALQSAE